MTIRILVNGARGKMGPVAVDAVNSAKDLVLVGQNNRENDLSEAIEKNKAQVVVDFTTPEVVFQNAERIIQAGARPVIGTTGLKPEQITQLKKICAQKKMGGIIVPNFSLGAVLMMKFAAEAAEYMPAVEIIEMHHPQKLDAPSGTAIKTAEMIAARRSGSFASPPANSAARGESHHAVPIHSVRLPGFYSHQSVIFGDSGEIFTLSHQGIDRRCCIPGIQLACRQVVMLNELYYGLENLLFKK